MFYILLFLADGARYGTQLFQQLEERTQGMSAAGAATLYRAIQYLLKEELIEEANPPPDATQDRKHRVYYTLTDFGRQVTGAEARRLEALVQEAYAKHILDEPSNTNDPENSPGKDTDLGEDPNKTGHTANGTNNHVTDSSHSRSSDSVQKQHRARAKSACFSTRCDALEQSDINDFSILPRPPP